jgi:hypothetical protein
MLGYAFDIVGERRIMDSKRISQRIREDTIELRLRNRKNEPVKITAIEHLWGDWEIVAKSASFEKKDAYTIEFDVTIPADSETVITYTVRKK